MMFSSIEIWEYRSFESRITIFMRTSKSARIALESTRQVSKNDGDIRERIFEIYDLICNQSNQSIGRVFRCRKWKCRKQCFREIFSSSSDQDLDAGYLRNDLNNALHWDPKHRVHSNHLLVPQSNKASKYCWLSRTLQNFIKAWWSEKPLTFCSCEKLFNISPGLLSYPSFTNSLITCHIFIRNHNYLFHRKI